MQDPHYPDGCSASDIDRGVTPEDDKSPEELFKELSEDRQFAIAVAYITKYTGDLAAELLDAINDRHVEMHSISTRWEKFRDRSMNYQRPAPIITPAR